jgi:spore germination cell wall hydrolase CwlJ-like protein
MNEQSVHSRSPDFLGMMAKIARVTLIVIGAMISLVVLNTATEAKIERLKATSNQPVGYQVATMAEREKQLTCLAQNIYHEAAGESFEGKVAVAQVTLNRANSGKFPDDICKVVYQKSVIYNRIICQFSWYCSVPGTKKPINSPAYDESYAVAKKVLLEGFKLDGIKTALYYHADYVNPKWGKVKIAQIGRHIFYADPVMSN